MIPLCSRGGIEEDDFGEIKYLREGHKSLDDSEPDFSLSAMLLQKEDFDSRINCVTLFLSL